MARHGSIPCNVTRSHSLTSFKKMNNWNDQDEAAFASKNNFEDNDCVYREGCEVDDVADILDEGWTVVESEWVRETDRDTVVVEPDEGDAGMVVVGLAGGQIVKLSIVTVSVTVFFTVVCYGIKHMHSKPFQNKVLGTWSFATPPSLLK